MAVTLVPRFRLNLPCAEQQHGRARLHPVPAAAGCSRAPHAAPAPSTTSGRRDAASSAPDSARAVPSANS